MRLILFALVAAVLLAGCSKLRRLQTGEPTPQRWDKWEHETKTLDDFDRDRYECQRDNPTIRRQIAGEMRDRCMLSKGWTRKP